MSVPFFLPCLLADPAPTPGTTVLTNARADALAAATSTAAYALGLDHLIGTVDPGKLADLVVVDGDPIEGIGGSGRGRAHPSGAPKRSAGCRYLSRASVLIR